MRTAGHTPAKTPATPGAFTPAPTGLLQRKCACGGSTGVADQCDACRRSRLTLQRGSAMENAPATVPSIVHQVLRSPGQPLAPATRSFFEPVFGHDFGHVRIHSDAPAARSARALDSLAYTAGHDIVFGEGQYRPGASEGRRLLAHELTHTVQQNPGRLPTTPSTQARDAVAQRDDPLEQEAEAVANRVLNGESVPRGAIVSATCAVQAQIARRPAGEPRSSSHAPVPSSHVSTGSVPDVLAQFDAAIVHLEALETENPELALDRLIAALESEQASLAAAPHRLAHAQQLIMRHSAIRSEVSRALPVIDALLNADYPAAARPAIHAELQQIRENYIYALEISDLPEAEETFNRADKDLRFFPGFMQITIWDAALEEVADLRRHSLGLPAHAAVQETTSATSARQRLSSAAARFYRAYALETTDPVAASGLVEELGADLQRVALGVQIAAEFERAVATVMELRKPARALTPLSTVQMAEVQRFRAQLEEIQQLYVSGDPDAEEHFRALLADPHYREFYKQMGPFLTSADWAARLGILVTSGVLTAGVGTALSGLGAVEVGGVLTAGSALRAGGVVVAEALTFTTAMHAGESVAFGKEFWPGFGTDVVWSAATFGALRIIGRHFALLAQAGGGATPRLEAAHLVSSYAALEGFAVARLGLEAGRLPSLEELLTISAENLVFMAALGMGARAARPILAEIGNAAVRVRFASIFGAPVDALQARRDALAVRIIEAVRTGTLDLDVLRGIREESIAIDNELRVLIEEAQTQPGFEVAHFEGVLRGIEEAQASIDLAELIIASGIRPLGPDAYTFEPGRAGVVTEYFRDRGAQVEPVVGDPHRSLVVRLTTGEVVVFLERPRLPSPALLGGAALRGRLGEHSRFAEVQRYPLRMTDLFTQAQRQEIYDRLQAGTLTLRGFVDMLPPAGAEQVYFRTPLGRRFSDHVFRDAENVMLRESKNVSDFSVTPEVARQLQIESYLLDRYPEAIIDWRISGNGRISPEAYDLLAQMAEQYPGRFRFQLQDSVLPPYEPVLH